MSVYMEVNVIIIRDASIVRLNNKKRNLNSVENI